MPETASTRTCSRGHTYRGSPPCPECWPSGHRRRHGEKDHAKRSAGDPEASAAPRPER